MSPDAPPPPDTEPYRQWTPVDGHDIHARVRTDRAPEGRLPAVLVHGQVVSSTYLVPTLRHLAPHGPVLAPDLPGYGASSKPDRVLDVDALADVLAGWMRAVDLPRAALLGNSFGCQVAAATAARHPEQVDRVVLQGPSMEPAARGYVRSLWRGAKGALREPPMKGIFREDYRRAGWRRGLATWRLMLHDAIEERLPHMPMPTLVVRGERDPIVSAEWAEEVARRLPRGEVVTIPAAAHTIVYHQPAALARVVVPFLERAAAPPEVSA